MPTDTLTAERMTRFKFAYMSAKARGDYRIEVSREDFGDLIDAAEENATLRKLVDDNAASHAEIHEAAIRRRKELEAENASLRAEVERKTPLWDRKMASAAADAMAGYEQRIADLEAEVKSLKPPRTTHEEGISPGEVRWLWHHDYYDGPLSGIGELNGEKVRITLAHEQNYCCRQRTYAVDRMPPEWMDAVCLHHADFQEMIGTHTDYAYSEEEERSRKIGECHMKRNEEFRAKYHRGSFDFNAEKGERLGLFADRGWDREREVIAEQRQRIADLEAELAAKVEAARREEREASLPAHYACKKTAAEMATLTAEVEHWKARADMRWSQQDLDNAKRDGERIHTIAEQRQRIADLEAELAAKVEARREERIRCVEALRTLQREYVGMVAEWAAINCAIAAIRARGTGPDTVAQTEDARDRAPLANTRVAKGHVRPDTSEEF